MNRGDLREATTWRATLFPTPFRWLAFRPTHLLQRGLVSLPKMDAVVMGASDQPEAFGPAVKARVTQEAMDEQGRFLGRNVQPNQAIVFVAKTALEKVLVAGEESWVFKPVQQADDVVIADARLSDLPPDEAARKSPRPEEVALIQRHILVQQIHAAFGRDGRRTRAAKGPS